MQEQHSINCYCNECVGLDYDNPDFDDAAEELSEFRQQEMSEQLAAM